MEFSSDLSVYNLLMQVGLWLLIWTIVVILWVVVPKKYSERDVFFWSNLMMLIMFLVVIVTTGLLHFAANDHTKTVLDTVRLIILIGTLSTAIGVLSYVNWRSNKRG